MIFTNGTTVLLRFCPTTVILHTSFFYSFLSDCRHTEHPTSQPIPFFLILLPLFPPRFIGSTFNEPINAEYVLHVSILKKKKKEKRKKKNSNNDLRTQYLVFRSRLTNLLLPCRPTKMLASQLEMESQDTFQFVE